MPVDTADVPSASANPPPIPFQVTPSLFSTTDEGERLAGEREVVKEDVLVVPFGKQPLSVNLLVDILVDGVVVVVGLSRATSNLLQNPRASAAVAVNLDFSRVDELDEELAGVEEVVGDLLNLLEAAELAWEGLAQSPDGIRGPEALESIVVGGSGAVGKLGDQVADGELGNNVVESFGHVGRRKSARGGI